MEVTLEQLQHALPSADPNLWLDPINNVLPRFNIDTPNRVAAFLANCAHESNGFTVLEENLNYSAAGLRRVWPARFGTDEIAKQYARNPQKIANKAYGNRMGNGPEYTGEGWKYRGRGLIQLTGKLNYYRCSVELFGDERLVDNPDLLLDPEMALLSACWFWDRNNVNAAADRGDHERITRIVNGGMNGFNDRVNHFNHMIALLDDTLIQPYSDTDTDDYPRTA